MLDRLHGEREAGSEGGSAGGWPRFLELDRCSLLPRDSGAFVTLVMESVAAEVRLRNGGPNRVEVLNLTLAPIPNPNPSP